METIGALAELALSSLPLPVMLTDRAGVLRWANASFTQLTGYPPEEILGQSTRLFHQTAAPGTERGTVRQKSGALIAVEQSRAEIANGAESYLVWTFREHRDHYERQCKALYDSMYEGVAIHRLVRTEGAPVNYLLLDVNRRFEEIIGVKRDHAIGKLATDVYQTVAAPYLDKYAAVCESGEAQRFETFFAPLAKHFLVSVTALGDDQFATIFVDTTKQHETEKQYKLISENTADVIWLWDLTKHHVSYTSPSVQKLRNLSPDEVHAQPIDQAMPPAVYRTAIAELRRRVLAIEAGDDSARVGSNEIAFLRKDGTPVETETVTTILTDDAGKARFVLGVSRDIRERRLLEQALRESEEKFAKIFFSNPAATVLSNIEEGDKLVDVNNAFEKFLGYTREEAVGRTTLELALWADPAQYAELITRLSASGSIDAFETKFRKQNGDLAIGLTSAEVIELNGNRCVLATTIDITERKKAEEALRRSERTFQKVFQSDPALKSINDVDNGQILDVNEAFERVMGYSREEAIGRTVTDLGLWVDEREESVALAQLRDNGSLQNFEHHFRKKNGEIGVGLLSVDIINVDGRLCTVAANIIITERKQTEEALRQSEERLRLTLDAANIVAFEINPVDGSHHEAGPVHRLFGRDTGFQHDKLANLQSSIDPRDREHVSGVMARALRGEAEYNLEFRVPQPDGSSRWIAANGTLLRDAGGKPARLLGVATDITPRKQAEDALRNATLQLQLMADNLQEAVVAYDMDRRLIFVNPAIETLTGYSADELRSENYINWIHPEDRARMMAAWESLFQGHSYSDERYQLVTRDGAYKWVEASWAPLLDSTGCQVGVQGVERNITKRHRAEEALAQSNLRLQLAAASAGLGIWEWDIASNALVWDDRMLDLYGISREEFSGSLDGWKQRVHPDDWQRAADSADNALRGDQHYNVEFRIVQPSGTVRHVKADGLVVRANDGRAIRMIGLNQDITEAKRANEDQKQLHARLVQAQKMESIGRLAGGIAHDFNNLLTVINGYSKLVLAEVKQDDPLRDPLEEIQKAGERATALTRQLLAFSRRQVMQTQVLDLNQVVIGMRSMLDRIVGEDISVHLTLSAEPPIVRADPNQLEQVVMNLAVNARDAMPHGGSISIETTTVTRETKDAGDAGMVPYAMLKVADTGSGMDEATMSRIFEPFFTTKGSGQGTGLGLSMVQGIVEQSGGSIEIDSQPGLGTSFRVYLPSATGAMVQETPAAAPQSLRGSETILVVEDEREVRTLAAGILKQYGYRVIEATGGLEALVICERDHTPVHLVLTDVVMPHMNGMDFVAQLTKSRPAVKALFMSGYTENDALEQAIARGAHFLQKPFLPEQLAEKIRSILDPRRPTARLYIVDDDPGIRSLLRRVLEKAGYSVGDSEDGANAILKARAGEIDMVITDLVMPGREGPEIIQALRRSAPHLGIIAISGAFGGQFLEVARQLGADAVLPKPIDAKQLMLTVAEVLLSRPH